MADLGDWGVVASDNNITSPDGAQTGWVGADVGPWARESMAAVARWYADPAWVNPMKFALDPTGNKTIARSTDTSIVVSSSSNWGTTTVDTFQVGRLIRVQRTTGEWVYGFIVSRSTSTTALTVELSLMGTAVITSGWLFSDNALEFYSALTETTTNEPEQAMSPIGFGGVGTTAERNARVPSALNAPTGLLWVNTTDDLIQVVSGTLGARTWKSVAPLASVFADAGASIILDSVAASNSSVLLKEAGTNRSQFYYDASGGNTVIEGGDTSAVAGRMTISNADGQIYHQRWSGGVAGEIFNMNPGRYMVRTGAGASGVTVGTAVYVEMASGALPSDVQTLLESSSWDSMKVDLLTAVNVLLIATPPSSGTIYLRVWLGSGYDTTPPASLSSGYQLEFKHNAADTPSANPIASYWNGRPDLATGRDQSWISNADLTGTVDSYYVAMIASGFGSPHTVTWNANTGNHYAGLMFRDSSMLVT